MRFRALASTVLLTGPWMLACAERSADTATQPPAAASEAPPPAAAPAAAPATPTATRLDADTVRREAAALGKQMEIPPLRWAEIQERLETLITHADFKGAFEHRGVTAVGAYRLGEGGAVVKITRGEGLLKVGGENGTRKFDLKATSIGAVVGGSAGWGVVLLVGADSADAFPGSYKGTVTAATAWEETVGVARLDNQRGHSLYFVGAAAGLSANAGKAKLTVAFEDAPAG